MAKFRVEFKIVDQRYVHEVEAGTASDAAEIARMTLQEALDEGFAAKYRSIEGELVLVRSTKIYMTQKSKETPMAGKSPPRGFSSESVSRASTRVWKEQSGMRSALLGTKTTQ